MLVGGPHRKENPTMARVVAVEDEPNIIRLYQAALAEGGHEVVACTDPRQALEVVLRERPEAVLLDLSMPHLTGADVLKLLKNDQETKEIPVVLVTAFPGRLDELSDCPTEWLDAVLVKPFGVSLLRWEIDHVLGLV
jgi:two-component system, cell cycle response regulator DivK